MGEVQFGTPALAVLERVGEEVQTPPAGDEEVVDRLDADRGEALGDDFQGRLLVSRGDDRMGDERLPCRASVADQEHERNQRQHGRDRPWRVPEDSQERDDRGGCGAGDDAPPGGAGLLAFHVGAHPVVVAGTTCGDGQALPVPAFGPVPPGPQPLVQPVRTPSRVEGEHHEVQGDAQAVELSEVPVQPGPVGDRAADVLPAQRIGDDREAFTFPRGASSEAGGGTTTPVITSGSGSGGRQGIPAVAVQDIGHGGLLRDEDGWFTSTPTCAWVPDLTCQGPGQQQRRDGEDQDQDSEDQAEDGDREVQAEDGGVEAGLRGHGHADDHEEDLDRDSHAARPPVVAHGGAGGDGRGGRRVRRSLSRWHSRHRTCVVPAMGLVFSGVIKCRPLPHKTGDSGTAGRVASRFTPPQIPHDIPRAVAYARHAARAGQSEHRALAFASRASRSRPDSPSGPKNK